MHLVQVGMEWGRTPSELAELLTTDELYEVLAGYAIQHEELEKRREERKKEHDGG